jgi:hypothetical protein
MHWQCELRVVQALRDLTEQLTTPVHPVDELGQGRLASRARVRPVEGFGSWLLRRGPVRAARVTPEWKVESREPVTISPAIEFQAEREGQRCGFKGSAVQGKWINKEDEGE